MKIFKVFPWGRCFECSSKDTITIKQILTMICSENLKRCPQPFNFAECVQNLHVNYLLGVSLARWVSNLARFVQHLLSEREAAQLDTSLLLFLFWYHRCFSKTKRLASINKCVSYLVGFAFSLQFGLLLLAVKRRSL